METGQNKFDNRLQEVENELEEHVKQIGLPIKEPAENIKKYLTNSQNELKSLGADDCQEIAIELGQYSLFLQQLSNKYVATSAWVEANIENIISKVVHSYPGYSYLERKNAAIRDNSVAMKMEKFKTELNLKKHSMYQLADKVDKIADFYSRLGNSKRWKH